MEEMQEKEVVLEPEKVSDNSNNNQIEGQANNEAPSEELILGKFKSVEDLSKAYKELERHQGIQSEELGELRQNSAILNSIKQAWEKENSIKNAEAELKEAAKKYNSPEYFQDPSFREMYKEAYLALGKNLDPDRFISLLEGYVSSRIFALEKSKAANSETQKLVDSMNFSKNNVSSIIPPRKRLDEMTSREVDELLDRLI